jgi:hypothetical protein
MTTKTKSAVVRIYNKSNQTIPIQLCPPDGDFFLHQQCVYVRAKQTVTVPKSYLNEDQIKNLQMRRELQILFDSDDAAERKT